MGGIEVLFATVVFIIATVGLVRGPSRELGVTMALVVLLAVFAQFNNLIPMGELPLRVNNVMTGIGLGSSDPVKQKVVVWFIFTGVTILTAFLAYHGTDTLKFSFPDPPGLGGVILGWLIGGLNGYLMAGTSWYYLHQLNYPIQRYDWFVAQFTHRAEDLVNILPQNLVGGLVLSALALVLLWWRILR